MSAPARAAAPRGAAAVPRELAAEVVDLKRVRFGGVSVAAAGFTRAWTLLARGGDVVEVAHAEARAAIAATQLGAIDALALRTAGLADAEIAEVLVGALDAVDLPASVRDRLGAPVGVEVRGDPPEFVARLAAAPRAGVTAPGRPRYVLEPTESHAEHCWVVAVLAVLLAEDEVAAGEAFLCGLAHHLHNAWLPDGGFAGETALGHHLGGVLSRLRERGLEQLATVPGLAERARAAITLTEDADSAAGRAFNAADVLDRLLELRFHERSAAFTLREAVEEYEVVHAGPLQAFGLDVARAWGLA